MSRAKGMYLPVRVQSGLFSDEYAVEIETNGGILGTVYVDRHLVARENNKYYLKLNNVVRKNRFMNVLLPSEIIELGTRWLKVEIAEIEMI